jgi:phosphotransferase system enzyme I (PtsP)
MMLEVPSLVFHLDHFRGLVDFVAIGSNDFTQYLLAVDRGSETVGHLYTPYHPAVMRALDQTLSECTRLNLDVSVCGELAGSVSGALALTALGYRALSVAPPQAAAIAYLCRRLDQQTLAALRPALLEQHDEREIARSLDDALGRIDPLLLEVD